MKNEILYIINRLLRIGVAITSMYIFYYIGFKGVIGFGIGVIITSYIFMTDNITVNMLMQQLGVRNEKTDKKYAIKESAKENRRFKVKYERN